MGLAFSHKNNLHFLNNFRNDTIQVYWFSKLNTYLIKIETVLNWIEEMKILFNLHGEFYDWKTFILKALKELLKIPQISLLIKTFFWRPI